MEPDNHSHQRQEIILLSIAAADSNHENGAASLNFKTNMRKFLRDMATPSNANGNIKSLEAHFTSNQRFRMTFYCLVGVVLYLRTCVTDAEMWLSRGPPGEHPTVSSTTNYEFVHMILSSGLLLEGLRSSRLLPRTGLNKAFNLCVEHHNLHLGSVKKPEFDKAVVLFAHSYIVPPTVAKTLASFVTGNVITLNASSFRSASIIEKETQERRRDMEEEIKTLKEQVKNLEAQLDARPDARRPQNSAAATIPLAPGPSKPSSAFSSKQVSRQGSVGPWGGN